MTVPLDSAEISVLIDPRNDSRLPEIHTGTMDYPWRIPMPRLIEGVCSTDCRLGEYGFHGLSVGGVWSPRVDISRYSESRVNSATLRDSIPSL
jgi:hypothetical protein